MHFIAHWKSTKKHRHKWHSFVFLSFILDQIDGKFELVFFLSFQTSWFVLTEAVNYRIYIWCRMFHWKHMLVEIAASVLPMWSQYEYIDSKINPVHIKASEKKSHIIGELFKCLALAVLLSFGEQRFRISIYSQQKQKLWWNTPMPIPFTPPALNGLTVMPMRIIWHLLKNFLIAFFSLTKSNTRIRDFPMYFLRFFSRIEIILPS